MTLGELYFALKDLYEEREEHNDVYVSSPALTSDKLVCDVGIDEDGYIVIYTL